MNPPDHVNDIIINNNNNNGAEPAENDVEDRDVVAMNAVIDVNAAAVVAVDDDDANDDEDEEDEVEEDEDEEEPKPTIESIHSILEQMKRIHDQISDPILQLHTLCTELQGMSNVFVPSSFHDPDLWVGDESNHLFYLSQKLLNARGDWYDGFRFAQQCIAVRTNDPRYTEGVMAKYYQQHLFPLGYNYNSILNDCFAPHRHTNHQHTSVTHLSLHMNDLIEPDDDMDVIVTEHISNVLHYVETSPALQRVSLSGGDTTNAIALAAIFFTKMMRNPSIARFDSELLQIPPERFHQLVTSPSCTIQHLSLGCFQWEEYTIPNRVLLLRAFREMHPSVTHLQLIAASNSMGGCTMRDAILRCLTDGASSSSSIETLTLTSYRTDEDHLPLTALRHYLQTTTSLQHLVLERHMLHRESMACILDGLQRQRRHDDNPNDTTTTTTQAALSSSHEHYVKKLSLSQCRLDHEAGLDLKDFLRSPLSQSTTTRSPFFLKELTIERPYLRYAEEDEEEVQLGAFPCGGIMGFVLVPLSGPSHQATIGSSLQQLSLDPFYKMSKSFCNLNVVYFKSMQLPKLHLASIRKEDCARLAKCVPYWTSLRELHLSKVHNTVKPYHVLALIRESDNVQSLSVKDEKGNDVISDSTAQAYCMRNQVLYNLLRRKVYCRSSRDCRPNKRPRYRPNTDDDDDDDDDMCVINEALLFPMLLQTAKQIPRTRLTTVFSSLLMLEMDCTAPSDD